MNRLCLVMGIGLSLVLAVPVTGSVPTSELREVYFATLGDQQRIQVLRQLESQQGLSNRERGARYRWGSIPADRTPPDSLGTWWSSLSERKKRSYRLRWFQKYYRRLEPKRAAEILGQSQELESIRQDLMLRIRAEDIQFEDLPFPNDMVDTPAQPPTVEDVLPEDDAEPTTDQTTEDGTTSADTTPTSPESSQPDESTQTADSTDTAPQPAKDQAEPDTTPKRPDPSDISSSDTTPSQSKTDDSSDTQPEEPDQETEEIEVNPPVSSERLRPRIRPMDQTE